MRLSNQSGTIARYPISIHTPAKGATIPDPVKIPGPYNFNPHTREGCDTLTTAVTLASPKFQSTHPRRVRQANWTTRLDNKDFNPHTREGCDLPAYPRPYSKFISIHTPAKGATPVGIEDHRREKISIHTPAKGATSRLQFRYQSPGYFNPHTREGCDLLDL